ncbi:MAG: hypothetical protein IJ049_01045, partial [Oscillospiraceae bacterium]|nr:hypothetical protein [Oscillospiraceae bacterium]
MPYMSRDTKRNIFLFLSAFLIAEIESVISPPGILFKSLSAILYTAILIAWTLTASRRVVQRSIRRCLIGVSMLFVLLFLLRMVRYTVAAPGTTLSRWLWYWYYLPMTAVPLLLFFSALCIGKTDADRPVRRAKWLWLPCAMLVLGIATNDLHGWAFYSELPLTGSGEYFYGWMYYVDAAWQAGLIFAAFVLMLRRCRLSRWRRLAWVPVLPFVLMLLLLLLYGVGGGSPTLYGHRLYNFQEVYCFGIIAFLECCIQIGLIPTNTGYGEIFDLSSVRATLAEADDSIVYHSQNAIPLTDAQMQAAKIGAVRMGEHLYLRSAPISGGAVYWTEDHTVIDEMNGDLEEAAERIWEENVLIQEENRILEEKARYETQNRLYNQIAYLTHDRLTRIDQLLHEATDSEGAFRQNLALSTVLGAYVKRRGNLAILSADRDTLSLRDVLLSIHESMEYLTVYGVECGVYADKTAETKELPVATALLCYDLFQEAAESALPDVRTIMVHFDLRDGAQMTVMLDEPAALPDADW